MALSHDSISSTSCQEVHGTGRVLWCDDHKGHAGRAEVVGMGSEGGAVKIRSRAAPQEMQSEGSGSGNGAGSCGWLRLWGSVMNYGIQHTRGLQMLSRLMSNHGGVLLCQLHP